MNESVGAAKAFMVYHAKRCPECHISDFTSNNSGDHFCVCGRIFSDETALPSIYALESQLASTREKLEEAEERFRQFLIGWECPDVEGALKLDPRKCLRLGQLASLKAKTLIGDHIQQE